MSAPVRMVLAVRFHVPPSLPMHTLQRAHDECLRPFLEAMERHPSVPFCVSISGPVLEWMEEQAPDCLIRVRRMVEAGRVELLGGAYHAAWITAIPQDDARGQIEMMMRALETRFEVRPRGVWLGEGLWEPHVPSLLEGLAEYTLVEEALLREAGLAVHEPDGPVLTEDRGALLWVFPAHETLGRMIPWQPPEEAMAWIGERPAGSRPAVVVFAGDGGQFGLWPETRRIVHEERWLDRFLALVEARRQVVEPVTFARVLKEAPRRRLVHLCAGGARASGRKWLAQNREATLLHARSLDASRRLREVHPRSSARRSAERELFRAQGALADAGSTAAGALGGAPRDAAFRHVIRALNAVEEPGSWGVEERDFDLDGLADGRLWQPALNVWVCPARGGRIFGWDLRDREVNLCATPARSGEMWGGLVAHFRRPQEDFAGVETGTFAGAAYRMRLDRTARHARAELEAQGSVAGEPFQVRKEILLAREEPEVQVACVLEHLGSGEVHAAFGLEFALAMRDGPDGWELLAEDGRRAEAPVFGASRGFWVADGARGFELACFLSRPARVRWEAVEAPGGAMEPAGRGLEAVVVTPFWVLRMAPGERWEVRLTWRAQGRRTGPGRGPAECAS